jgi:hypothetical protein
MNLLQMSEAAGVLLGRKVGFKVRSLKTGNEFIVTRALRGGTFLAEGVNVVKDSILDGSTTGRYEAIGHLATVIDLDKSVAELNREIEAVRAMGEG